MLLNMEFSICHLYVFKKTGILQYPLLPVRLLHTSEKNPHQHMLDFIHIIDVDKRRRKKITKESHQI